MTVKTFFHRPKQLAGRLLIRYLTSPSGKYQPFSVSAPEVLQRILKPGDVLLVEGNQHFSTAVKYLTQSTWSHAAMYVGDLAPGKDSKGKRLCLIEADLEHGVTAVPLCKYEGFNTRICRPAGLSTVDCDKAAQFMVDSLGLQYDLKNLADLARYLLPTPLVPVRWRRRMLAFGSGDPTRVICSTRIAEAFQSVRYPVLPHVEKLTEYQQKKARFVVNEILHIRHHTLFTPRDFDLSPYFAIIKPTLENGFDYKQFTWSSTAMDESGSDLNVI